MALPQSPASPLFLREAEIRRGIELLHFGHGRLFDAVDRKLEAEGLGRAHHRALYFIARQPDLTVSRLLALLGITKQSLGRVLKQLIDEGYVEQRKGADRRQRLLFVTAKGESLALKLAGLQTARIGRALTGLEHCDLESARRFLIAMLDPGQRDSVLRLIDGGDSRRRRL